MDAKDVGHPSLEIDSCSPEIANFPPRKGPQTDATQESASLVIRRTPLSEEIDYRALHSLRFFARDFRCLGGGRLSNEF